MSENGRYTLVVIAEKFLGLILITIGALAAYYTFTSGNALGYFKGFFSFLNLVLLALGLFLTLSKAE
jgi:hypothetical protein